MPDKTFLIGLLIIGLLAGVAIEPNIEKALGREDDYSLICIEGHQYIYKSHFYRTALTPSFDDEGIPVKCSMK